MFHVNETYEWLDSQGKIDVVCKALADPIRRSLLKILGEKQYFCHLDGETVNGVCVQDLSKLLKLPQSTVSRHLSILRQAGLVGHEQKGTWHYYYCRVDTLKKLERWIQSMIPKNLDKEDEKANF